MFLRSFLDSERTVSETTVGRLTLHNFIVEDIVKDLQRFGPVVALTDPRVKTRPIGYSPMDSSEQHWREDIIHLLERAIAIELLVGSTEGLAFELWQIEQRGWLQKTVFFVPPGSKDNHDRLRWLFERLGVSDNAEVMYIRDPLPPAGEAEVVLALRVDSPRHIRAYTGEPNGPAAAAAVERATFEIIAASSAPRNFEMDGDREADSEERHA